MTRSQKSLLFFSLPVLLTVVVMLSMAGHAQTPEAGGTLGIDCEQPRRNADGKLILNDDGSQRARCEADRATALNYALVVKETRNRLRAALEVLPPPLWDGLVEHLQTNDEIGAWRYGDEAGDAAVLARIEDLSRLAPPGDQNEIATADRAHRIAGHWQDGILEASEVLPDWRGIVKARACGFGPDGTLLPPAMILVWLDPTNLRDRWSPEMVQRTVRAWLERGEGSSGFYDHIPDILTSGQLKRFDGRSRDISGNAETRACFLAGPDPVPEGALVMRTSLHRNSDFADRDETCPGDVQVGRRKFRWERHNGVFIVPHTAIRPDGSPHPDRGQPLLDPPMLDEAGAAHLIGTTCRTPRTLDAVRVVDCPAVINETPVTGKHVRTFRFREVQNDPSDPFRIDRVPVGPGGNGELGVIAPAGAPHPLWEETTLFCEGEIPPSDAPDIPPRVPDDWGYPDCAGAHGGRFDEGTRTGYSQTITYPEGWPVDETVIRTIDDDCFNPVREQGNQTRPGTCPAGQTGSITERRTLSWWNRDWAVPLRHEGGDEGDRTLVQAAAAYDAGPSQAGRPWFNVVQLVQDWHETSNSCRAQCGPFDEGCRCEQSGGNWEQNSGGGSCSGGEQIASGDDEQGNYSDGDYDVHGQPGRDGSCCSDPDDNGGHHT